MQILLKIFSSLKLTVLLLSASLLLIFFGTLDQVEYGIWETQKKYFESFFVVWSFPNNSSNNTLLSLIKIPLPGGYLLGGLLLINLLAAHITRFKLSWKKLGLFSIHLGLILLLISELITDLVSEESQMTIDEGQAQNYSETVLENELVLIEKSNPDYDVVHSISEDVLKQRKLIPIPNTRLYVKALEYFPNSNIIISKNKDIPKPNFVTENIFNLQKLNGVAKNESYAAIPKPYDYAVDSINTATCYIEVFLQSKEFPYEVDSLGVWLVSNVFYTRPEIKQVISVDNKEYDLELRFKRTYYPFEITLNDFKHDKYPGTEIPHNFSSAITINDFENNTKQNSLIYMNHPLRYKGYTFYQASFANNDLTSIFQVVKNPGWALPYISVLLMGLGMTLQFSMHFLKYLKKRKINE